RCLSDWSSDVCSSDLLKHRTAPFSPAKAISYFFLLPNVCFPLFPVVDYKTFCSTYYNEDWPRVYQTGLKWMFRGVFQLLLYRVRSEERRVGKEWLCVW